MAISIVHNASRLYDGARHGNEIAEVEKRSRACRRARTATSERLRCLALSRKAQDFSSKESARDEECRQTKDADTGYALARAA